MPRTYRSVTTILCEDVRQEIGNKHTIVGSWFADLTLSELPGNVRIAVLIVLQGLAGGHHEAKVELRLDKEAVAGVSFAMDAKTGEAVVLTLPQGLLAMSRPATLSVCMSMDGGRWATLTSSEIRLGATSVSAAPPSERTQPEVPEKGSQRRKRRQPSRFADRDG